MNKIIRSMIVIFVFAITFQSCQKATQEAETEDTGILSISSNMDKDVATVQRYIDALLASDSATLRSVVSSDFRSYFVKNPLDSSNIDEIVKTWGNIQADRSNQQNEAVASSSLRVSEGEYMGDWVQYWGTYSATINESGVDIVVPYFINVKMQDGLLHRQYTYYDRLAIQEAQGYELTKTED